MTAPLLDARAAPLLDVRALEVRFATARGPLRAVAGVDLQVTRGETLGIVGESGCGKSSLARAVVGLVRPSAGSVVFDGVDVTHRRQRAVRRRLQMVFQDPYASLNPRLTVGAALSEALALAGVPRAERAERVAALMAEVGLAPAFRPRFPHALSGGQRQRVGIARALALRPEALLLDEPVSALDVSVQAQVLNLLLDLQERRRPAMVFIAHHLGVVRHVSDRIAVMYLGRVVEEAPAEALFAAPLHPYTQALLAAVPIPDPVRERARSRSRLAGEAPSPVAPPSGCAFRTRCPLAQPACAAETPELSARAPGHRVACLRVP